MNFLDQLRWQLDPSKDKGISVGPTTPGPEVDPRTRAAVGDFSNALVDSGVESDTQSTLMNELDSVGQAIFSEETQNVAEANEYRDQRLGDIAGLRESIMNDIVNNSNNQLFTDFVRDQRNLISADSIGTGRDFLSKGGANIGGRGLSGSAESALGQDANIAALSQRMKGESAISGAAADYYGKQNIAETAARTTLGGAEMQAIANAPLAQLDIGAILNDNINRRETQTNIDIMRQEYEDSQYGWSEALADFNVKWMIDNGGLSLFGTGAAGKLGLFGLN